MCEANASFRVLSLPLPSVVTLSSLLLFGCTCTKHASPDVTSLIITPGVGIQGVAEVGMTLSDLRQKNPDMSTCRIEATDGITLIIPRLGLRSELDGGQKTVSALFFLVAKSGRSPADLDPFSGSLHGGLSFTGTNAVTRSEITRVYGLPQKTVSLNAYPEGVRSGSLDDETASMSITQNQRETLRYPQHGVSFNLNNGNVVQVVIRLPRGTAQSGD